MSPGLGRKPRFSVSKRRVSSQHPNNISPTLFLYGINDPVAGFGKGIRKIYTRYRAVNDQTEIESFPGAHDILHDEWREEVFKTIKEFLEK